MSRRRKIRRIIGGAERVTRRCQNRRYVQRVLTWSMRRVDPVQPGGHDRCCYLSVSYRHPPSDSWMISRNGVGVFVKFTHAPPVTGTRNTSELLSTFDSPAKTKKFPAGDQKT